MTNKMKLPSILALIVIIFLSLGAVSASDSGDCITDLTNSSDSAIDDTIAISNSNNDLTESFNDSNLEITDSKDLDDEIASPKESNKLGSSYEDPDTLSSEPIIIDSSSYSQYFDSNGKIKSGTLKDGDTIKIKSISDKIFTIDKRLNIISDDGASLSNCLIRLVKGSSGSVLENLKIVNTKEKINNYYLSGISIIDSSENTIKNSIINVSLHKCFAIMMSNASYNKIINNTLISGLSSTIPMTASSYNEIRDNYLESEYTNMIYQSAYGNGDFKPIEDEVCSGNIIANNYLKSRNGTYNSYCYAIYLMQTASGNGAVIANNTIEKAFYGIIVEAPNTLIYNNTISSIGGPAAILTTGSGITVSNNNISTEHTDVHDWNDDGNVVAIQNTGKNNVIANNTLRSVGSDSILNTGENVVIANNTIYTESANGINTTKSNVKIENNTIVGVNSTGVMIFTSRLAENITIRNNDFESDKSAIVLRGNVSYTLVCDNRISISGDSDAIAVLKYTNRNPITPSHNAIYNNTINGQVVNMTDPSEIERDDEGNGTGNGTSGEGTGVDEGTYSDSKVNTAITVTDNSIFRGNELVVFLKDKDGNPISGVNVTFSLLNQNYVRTTDGEGKASLQINANIGNYAMNISYAGNDTYNPCKVSTNISVLRNQFIVTEDNFYTCFDDNGYLKSDYEDYELIFKGNFNDKRIILDRPVILKSDGAKLLDSVIKIESDNVAVDGFTIINSNPGNAADNHRFAILLDNVKNVNVTNNDIQLESYDNGYGIYLSESSNCNILNNSVKAKANALTFGIMLYDSSKNTLKNNNIFVNGTNKPHLYDSTIKVDSSISVDDYEAEGMVIPEVYKTYGIILFYSSSNDIGYNNVSATSGVDKYYTAIKESTNSIVGIDLYYESNNNKVHHNNVNVTAKDPYLYGLGVLGAETGKRDQVSANNSFTDNVIDVNGTYYAAGIIAGYNSINTTMARNKIHCESNNVSYGAILEGADDTKFYKNNVSCNSRINYLVEGYDADNSRIYDNHIDYGDKALVVRAVALYNSNNNRVTNNSVPSLKPLIPRIVKEINRIWQMKYPESPVIFTEEDIIYKSANSPMIVRKNGTDYDLLDLLDYEPTSHPDVISPENQLFDDIGGKNNTFDNNVVRDSDGGSSGGSGSGSGGSNSGNGSNSGGSNSGSNGNGNGNGNNSGGYSTVDGTGIKSNSTVMDGNTVGTSSSAPVTESATAYNLNVDEDPAAARSLSLGGMNAPVLIILILLILACAAELIKRSKRDIK